MVDRGRRLIDLAVLQGKEAHGHTGQQIHIEGGDNVQPAAELGARTGQHEQIADRVHAHERALLGQGLQYVAHGRGGDELQGHNHGRITGGGIGGAADLGAQAQALLRPGDQVAAVFAAHQQGAVGLEQRLQHHEQFVSGHGRAGAQGHAAFDGAIDDVIQLQNIAENGVNDFLQGRLFKIQADLVAEKLNRLARGRQRHLQAAAGIQHGRHTGLLPLFARQRRRVAGQRLAGLVGLALFAGFAGFALLAAGRRVIRGLRTGKRSSRVRRFRFDDLAQVRARAAAERQAAAGRHQQQHRCPPGSRSRCVPAHCHRCFNPDCLRVGVVPRDLSCPG